MANSVTEVTHESWFSRIGGAIKGIFLGLILFVVAFPVLFWNEGRAVKRYKTLKEGGGAVITVASDNVDKKNAGKLIHVIAKANTDATLTDAVFGVSANALKLKRNVEMYQWKETSQSTSEKKMGGGQTTTTTYSYNTDWSDRPINSAQFKEPAEHQNPGSMPYESTQLIAEDVTLGSFALSPSLISMINNFTVLGIASDHPIPESLKDKAMLYDMGFYMGTNPVSPTIGDMRVTFTVAKPTDVSVIAQQVENTFAPYLTKVGGQIELLQTGSHTAEAMILAAQKSNKTLTLMLRIIGFVLMFTGLTMIFKLLSVLADVLPVLGNIVSAGTSIIAFLIAAVLSLITVAIAWIVYRPLLGIIMLVVAVGLTVAIKGKLKAVKAKSPKEPT